MLTSCVSATCIGSLYHVIQVKDATLQIMSNTHQFESSRLIVQFDSCGNPEDATFTTLKNIISNLLGSVYQPLTIKDELD